MPRLALLVFSRKSRAIRMQASQSAEPLPVGLLFNYLQQSDVLLFDLRPAEQYRELHIKTAIGIDVAALWPVKPVDLKG